MDKSSAALMLAESNLQALGRLQNKINNIKCVAVNGSMAVTSRGGTGYIVVFSGEGSVSFCGQVIATGTGTKVGVLPAGSGELTLSAGAQAILIN